MARSRRNREDREAKSSAKPKPKSPPKAEEKAKPPEPEKKPKGKAAEKKLLPHPECLKIPDHTEEGLAELTESVRKVGLAEAIVLLDGMILDGRGRYEACLRAKVAPRFVQWESMPESQTMTPLEYVLAKNYHRRHLDTAGKLTVFKNVLAGHADAPDAYFVEHLHMGVALVKKLRQQFHESGEIPDPGYRTKADGTRRPVTYKANKEDDKRRKDPPSANGKHDKKDYPKPEPPPDAGDSWEPGTDEVADAAAADAHSAEYTASGDRVPAHLADVFADPFYKDAADTMRRWTRHVRSRKDVYTRLLNSPAFLNHLKNAIQALEFASPYEVCKECDGSGVCDTGKCHVCVTTGWVSRGEAESREFTE